MSASGRPIVIGHRGAPGYRPEHTEASFRLAIALGADAVEPDLVPTRDGVLVVRHENEISGTTDVAAHPEFAARRTTKRIEGKDLAGWFVEDFTWDELSSLRAIERIPKVRPFSTDFDGMQPILRLTDLINIVEAAGAEVARPIQLVAELKHATYFASIGLPLDEPFAQQIAHMPSDRLVIESFEQTVLTQVRDRGIAGRYVALVEASGTPADARAQLGADAPEYASHLTPAGLARLADRFDGVSMAKKLALRVKGATAVSSGQVERAADAGLATYLWTLRAENRFLSEPFRRGRDKNRHGDWTGEFRLLLGTGVDGVFADQPDLVVTARDGV